VNSRRNTEIGTMGIDAVLQTSRGIVISSVGDPREYLGWALDMCESATLPLLRGIDPYDDTAFGENQWLALLSELDLLAHSLTDTQLAGVRAAYAAHHQRLVDAAESEQYKRSLERVTLDDVREHIRALATLVRSAGNRGGGHLVKFIGD
jgi:hypothetical protein